MEEHRDVNDIRLTDEGDLEYFDGKAWVTYPDVAEPDTQALIIDRRLPGDANEST